MAGDTRYSLIGPQINDLDCVLVVSEGRDEQIPMELFMRAWEAGHELVVVTTGTIKK